jgi:hypothetical protein
VLEHNLNLTGDYFSHLPVRWLYLTSGA